MSKYAIEEATLIAIGNAIRAKNGETNKYTPEEMVAAITNIVSTDSLPDEALALTGNLNHKFAYNNWDWFYQLYSNYITTSAITDGSYMFYNATKIKDIPFELNFDSSEFANTSHLFDRTTITELPQINNCKPYNMDYIFANTDITELPEDINDWFDWTRVEGHFYNTDNFWGKRAGMFYGCCYLRSIPNEFLNHPHKYLTTYGGEITEYPRDVGYCYFNNGFRACECLDELVDLPEPCSIDYSYSKTNQFVDTFYYCSRLKKITFNITDTVRWAGQIIDLSHYVGYANGVGGVGAVSSLGYENRVIDDATYQALKNTSDWWTTDIDYSRYNHDSAVETINSLPTTNSSYTSFYGINTIKFKSGSGLLTDGGAIADLTSEEIAVATAKGWTVALD